MQNPGDGPRQLPVRWLCLPRIATLADRDRGGHRPRLASASGVRSSAPHARPSGIAFGREKAGMPRLEGQDEGQGLQVPQLPGHGHPGEFGEGHLHHLDILVFALGAAATGLAIGGAIGGQEQVNLLGGDPRAGIGRADMVEVVQAQARLLQDLAPRVLLRRAAVDEASRGFQLGLFAGDVEGRDPQLAHERRHASLWIVKKDADGIAVILDLALGLRAIGQPDLGQPELGPAVMNDAEAEDFGLHRSLLRMRGANRRAG